MRESHQRIHLSQFYSSFYKGALSFAIMISAVFLLQGCQSTGGYNTQPWMRPANAPASPAQQTPSDLSVDAVQRQTLGEQAMRPNNRAGQGDSIKVAILLPLSGGNAKLGKSMLNAAQMALFDVGHSKFELLPFDTMGTANGARTAARSALQDGAKLVLGPVFSSSVQAARQVTQSANINMIAFSTDWTLANKQTFLIGFLPFDQIERITHYASYSGYKNIGVISPLDSYGNGVVSAYKSISRQAGIQSSRIERFSQKNHSLSAIMREFTDYDARKSSQGTTPAPLPFDAVLMPVGGPRARELGSYLNHYDLTPDKVKRLGTGLMDDVTLAQDRTLNGSWFAAPEPKARAKFERNYNTFYGAPPPRISSLAYDATALAAILSRIGLQNGNNSAFNHRSITNPNGFSGIDGIFRFRPDGIVERGLAVLEYRNGRIVVVDKAPRTFQRATH